MSIRNIVWTAADRGKWLALAGILAITAACSKSPVVPSDPGPGPNTHPVEHSLYGSVLTAGPGEEGSVAIEGARIEISREEQVFETFTDADGWYQFSNLSAGTWTILVQKEGYADARAEVELTDSASIDFMLEPMDK